MAIDPFDYKEPACPVCGGEDFYYPDPEKPSGTIPVRQMTEKLDSFLNRNDMIGAERLLDFWLSEARALKDKRGELSVLSEQMGLYRKLGKKEEGVSSVEDGLRLIDELSLWDTVSGATIALNAATTYKAFGYPEKGIAVYERVEKVYESALSPVDVRKAGLYNNRALGLTDLGRFAEAERDYLSALAILKANSGEENDVAVTYVNMAHLYEKLNEDERVYECMEKALEYLNGEKTVRNGYHAYVCSKCAPSFEYFGYFLASEELSARAKEIYERA